MIEVNIRERKTFQFLFFFYILTTVHLCNFEHFGEVVYSYGERKKQIDQNTVFISFV